MSQHRICPARLSIPVRPCRASRAGETAGRDPVRPLSRPLVFLSVLLMGLGACSATPAGNGAKSAAATEARAADGQDKASAPQLAEESSRKYGNSELGRALALLDSNPAGAASALDKVGARTSLIDDVILYYGALARTGTDPGEARQRLEKLIAAMPDSVLVGDAVELLAEILEKQKDLPAATALADRFGGSGASGPASARACLAAGRLLVATDVVRAAGYLECARSKAPQSSAGRAAYDPLVSIRASHPALRPTGAAALLREARQLSREGRSAQQLATLDLLFAESPSGPYTDDAVLSYARALAASRGKAAAADYLQKHCTSAASLAANARCLYETATWRWNDNQDADASLLFERMLALRSGIPEEGEAAYAIARIDDAAGKRAEAIAAYARAAKKATGATRADCLWRQGWVAYRARDWQEAERLFGAMVARTTEGSEDDGRGSALYWQARSLERLGRTQDATPLYKQVLAEFPVGYYSLMAEKRLGRAQQLASRPIAAAGADSSRRAQLPAQASRALERAEMLNEAGLGSLAARDLGSRLASFDDTTRRTLLPSLQQVGAYDAAFRIAANLQKSGRLSREEARPYLYPQAHVDVVLREARKAGIDPLLVYALMRQESAFSAHAVSSANALGLMQLLQKTADRLATQSGAAPPQREDLFEPGVNIRYGVRYLSELSRLFQGNTALMLAAYNAGENAAQRWQGLATKWDEDEMIEQISYRETRAYVKSVLRNLRTYRALYAVEPVASVASVTP